LLGGRQVDILIPWSVSYKGARGGALAFTHAIVVGPLAYQERKKFQGTSFGGLQGFLTASHSEGGRKLLHNKWGF
jgi:hypothetical protein